MKLDKKALSAVYQQASEKMEAKLKTMGDPEIDGLVSAAVAKSKEQTKGDDLATKQDEAVAKDAEFKAVESALSKRITDKLTGGGYVPGAPLGYPL